MANWIDSRMSEADDHARAVQEAGQARKRAARAFYRRYFLELDTVFGDTLIYIQRTGNLANLRSLKYFSPAIGEQGLGSRWRLAPDITSPSYLELTVVARTPESDSADPAVVARFSSPDFAGVTWDVDDFTIDSLKSFILTTLGVSRS